MKKILSTVTIMTLLLTGFSAFADTGVNGEVMPILATDAVPTLYGEAATRFELKQAGDGFTITLDENVTTGYSWIYTVNDETKVGYISDEQVGSGRGIPGAGGTHSFTFKSIGEGLSSITFYYQRPWEKEAIDTVNILVVKTGDQVNVQENAFTNAVYNQSEAVVLSGAVQIVDGVTMVPLRSTLEALGYEVTWNGSNQSIEIKQGAQWTSIKINENSYFKNRMAAAPLSAAPVLVNSVTLVPIEFFSVVLDCGVQVDNEKLIFSGNEAVIYSGYVKELITDEKGNTSMTLTSDMASDDIMLQTIIHTSASTTVFNKAVAKGNYINVVASMIMTMSIPGQTSGYIIY